MADIIKEEYPIGPVPKAVLDAIAEDYHQAVKDQASPAEVKATTDHAEKTITNYQSKVAAGVEKAIESFVPDKNPGRPWFLKASGLDHIAMKADEYFGVNNPVRKIEKIVNARPVLKAKIRAQILARAAKGIPLRRKYAKTGEWSAMEDLMHDSRMLQVHPDQPLDHKLNKHLGTDSLDGAAGRSQHPDLARRYEALPDELKEHFGAMRDTYTDTQDRMARGTMQQTLKMFKDPAMADRFFEGTQTDADVARIGHTLANHIERAEEVEEGEGSLFPGLKRFGDFAVVGKHQLYPAGGQCHPDLAQRVRVQDPQGGARLRRKDGERWAACPSEEHLGRQDHR